MWCGIVCVFVEKLKRLKICVDGVRERKTKNLWSCGLNTVIILVVGVCLWWECVWWECAVGVESLCFRRKIENIAKRCGDFLFCGLHIL